MTDYSRQDMSYAVRLANRGYSVDAIFHALAKKPKGRREPASMKYMRLLDEKGSDSADDYARTTARKAIAFVAANPRIIDKADALVRITEIKATADAMPWGVYAGPRTRRALEGAFVVAERVGGVAFGLALREWAEICGLDLRALQSERDRLVRFD